MRRKCCARAHVFTSRMIGSSCEQALREHLAERSSFVEMERKTNNVAASPCRTCLPHQRSLSPHHTTPSQLLTTPSITSANATTAPWPTIPIIQTLQRHNSYINITSRWPLRDSSPSYSQATSKDITHIVDTKFAAGQGRDEEPVTDVDAHIAAVKFHLQATEEGASISLYEAREIVVGVRGTMEKYGPAIVYGRYVRDGVTRASLSCFVEAEVRRGILKV